MTSVIRPALLLALLLPLAAAHGSARADDEVSTDPEGRILHRRLPPPPGAKEGTPVFVYDPRRGGSLPREFQRDGQMMPRPESGSEPAEGEAAYSRGGLGNSGEAAPEDPDAGRPSPPEEAGEDGGSTGPSTVVRMDPRGTLGDEARPDRDTDKEGTLGYHSVFDPTVVPFKRNRTLDTVAEDGSLVLGPGSTEVLEPVGNHAGGGREVFWGSILVIAEPGEEVPLPSVSPASRILSWEATPPRNVTFLRDAADNHYVRSAEGGRFRLIFLMDAPTSWFGRPLPRGATVQDVPPDLRPRLPDSMAPSAREVARDLGLSRRMDYATVIRRLVHHFRSFEAGDPPPESDDVYRDLALGGRGICRHRVYAFVVTAHGLGIPARYTFNEAHVFAEVWLPGPEAGWLRVDLGGGAERLVVEGADDKVRHRVRGRDPFDRPEAYARQLGQGPMAGATEVEGLPPARRPGRDAGGDHEGGETTTPSRALLPAPMERPVAGPEARPTRTTLSIERAVVYRGTPVTVRGRVTTTSGEPVPGGRVQLLLRSGSDGQAVGLLGVTPVGADGRFESHVTIPEEQPPGGYEIVAGFLGSARWRPSRSP
ncbi:MAG: transglutaminase domain-containing protein [Myxococcota bacterium]